MKYLYTPFDLAVFFRIENLKLSEEQNMLEALWQNKDSEVLPCYRNDKPSFKKEINNELHMMEGYLEDVDALNLIFQELGSKFSISDSDYGHSGLEVYFKVVRLRLSYSHDTDYCKIKLRNLLRRFGYKKRTKSLMEYINVMMNELELYPYLRGRESCDLGKVSLDDMIIFRKK